jgi:hypothetical protein
VLGRGWEPGEALIVARRVVVKGTDEYHVAYEYIADVQPDGPAAPFRATFKERFYGGECHEPEPGERARVRFRAKKNEVELDRAPLREAQKAAQTEQDERFEAIADAAPGSPVPGTPATARADAAPAGPPEGLPRSIEILQEIMAARAAGDTAEVARLKAEMARLQAERPG